MDLSFSGAGFMGCYYFGVVNCWNKYIPRERVRRAAGASAGSLIAAYYLMDLPLSECLKEIIEMTEEIRRRPLGVFDRSNQIVDVLPKKLERMFPEDAHKRCSGRLFVCMTRLRDMKCVIVNEFETKKDLIDALNCSCFIPVWSGNHVATYKGQKYIDGGFTNNLPVFDEHTIRICCFSGASDIAPYDRSKSDFLNGNLMGMPFNWNWKNMCRAGRALWPPPASFIIELLERGFHDAKSFILSNDLIQCNSCFKATEPDFRPLCGAITPTISPSVSRASSYMNLADLQRAGSFRRQQSSNKSPAAKGPHPATLATIKELERMLRASSKDEPSVFETKRSKSGRQITLKALRRNEEAEGERKSFTKRLREKLARVGSGGSGSNKAPSSDESQEETGDEREQLANWKRQVGARQPQLGQMPTIVVDEPQDDQDLEQFELASQRSIDAQRKRPATIEEIMRQASEEQSAEAGQVSRSRSSASRSSQSASSSSSAHSTADESGDSAVSGLCSASAPEAAGAARVASQSPAEKFLASRKMSLVASQLDLQKQEGDSLLPDRFSFAPSQLPSCPPSPNLNRHCGECIRMRQQARMDEIDASIKCEAEKYHDLEERDPEKEFSGIRYKLASWFRQLGAPKYSYEFAADSDDEDTNNNHTRPSPHQMNQRRPSEIPTS